MYDVAIIGAGINGCAMAHSLCERGQRVLLLDTQSIASGGSGAAGAFISPKFSKEGDLKELIEKAFCFSMEFYTKKFPHCINTTPLLHIANDAKSAQNLKFFKQDTSIPLKQLPLDLSTKLHPQVLQEEHIFLDAGIVNAKKVSEALSKDATYIQEEVKNLEYKEHYWLLNTTHKAKKVVLATGAYKSLIDEPYSGIRGIWGHRIDIETSTTNNYSIHQFVSISPSHNGVIAVGATHDVHYHPQKNKESYNIQKGREELLEKASKTLPLKDVKVIKDYTGLRSGSTDYMPLLGRVVRYEKSLNECKKSWMLKKPQLDKFYYYENLYMINGNGGYGFVLAPYLADMLTKHMLDETKIEDLFAPARFFARWAKKQKKI